VKSGYYLKDGGCGRRIRLASVEKAKKLIGYEPKTPFKEGLMKTIDWFRKNWDDIEKSASFGPGISSAVRDR